MKKNVIIIIISVIGVSLAITNFSLYEELQNRRMVTKNPNGSMSQDGLQQVRDEAIQSYSNNLKKTLATSASPKILFDPSFTDQDESTKADILKKVLQPYIDFENERNSLPNRPQILIVHKLSKAESENSSNKAFTFFGLDNSGQSAGWSGGYFSSVQSPLPYWYPECMGTCKFSEAYKKKYPEVLNAYNTIVLNQKN